MSRKIKAKLTHLTKISQKIINPVQEKWSHIAKEYVVSLFPNICLISAMRVGLKRSVGNNLKFFAQRYENNSCQYLVKSSDWREASEKFAAKILKNPEKLDLIIREIKKLCEKCLALSFQIAKIDLRRKSNRELLFNLNNFVKINEILYGYGLSLVFLDYQDMSHISNKLSAYLKERVNEKNYSNYFTILSTPAKRTAAREEEIDLIKIIAAIYTDKKTKNFIADNDYGEAARGLPMINKKIHNKIISHNKKFGWITYVYEGPAMRYEDFILFIKDFIKRGDDPSLKLKEILGGEKKLRATQNNYLKKLKPNSYFKKIIKLSQDITYIKPWRRNQQSYCYFLIENLLKEMARRLNISIKQLRFILPEELDDYLVRGKSVNIEKINKRIKLCVLVFENGGKLRLLEGEKAKKFISNIEEEKIDFNKKEFFGQTACVGKVKARVKIINTPDDMVKMAEGDILVSFATNPNLMPAIRKAGAIVTDEGGLTCHAAIVSRELKIPCIIGTKIATKVFKDGDLVEVDANRGIIKIIKQKLYEMGKNLV